MTPKEIQLTSISPFFIVGSLRASLEFYQRQLGFEVQVSHPAEQPFFAVVGRDRVQLYLKEIGPDVTAAPNHLRHEWAPWDAFVWTQSPEQLAASLEARGTALHRPLTLRDDKLYGFEVMDPDGYVLFFGRPD